MRNQKPAGINLREFYRLFQQGYEKKHKKDPKLTESEYLKQFLNSIENHYERMKDWETKFMRKRSEYLKTNLETKKKQIIKDILQSNPLASIVDLEKEVQKIGLHGLSVKEKIQTLNNQLTLLQLNKNYHEEKKDQQFGDDRVQKQIIKIENVDQQIASVKKQLDEQQAIFSGYFKNVMLFKDKEFK